MLDAKDIVDNVRRQDATDRELAEKPCSAL
jgi:hypothetical protein